MEKMFCGVELHHFHDESDSQSVVMPGSIEVYAFEKIINELKKEYCLINADVWIEKILNGRLADNEICLTFDDTIKSQFTVAKKVLDAFGIKAFFFIYTGMFHEDIPRLEVYRYFTTKFYDDFQQFFQEFTDSLHVNMGRDLEKILKIFPDDYLKQFVFYSREDRIYRFIRDNVLTEEEYNYVMDQLIETKTSMKDLVQNQLWMNPDQIRQLSNENHVIGLHSVSHPLNLGERSDQEQDLEYRTNKIELEEITGKQIISVSYPSSSYNDFTITLMKKLGINIGFKTSLTPGHYNLLDIPRMDSGRAKKIKF